MTAPDQPDRAQPERADPSRSAESATSAGLQLFLVRLRPSGTVCWVGSIHQHRHPETGASVGRGDRVVIENAHGQWLAELLRTLPSSSRVPPDAVGEGERIAESRPPPSSLSPSDSSETTWDREPKETAPRPAGELLRIADATDEAAERCACARAQQLLDATRREPLARDVVIVATEVSLAEQIGIIRILGTADERFGPAAVRLATKTGLQRIQWIDVSQQAGSSQARDETDADAAARSCTPEQAEEAEFWQRMQQVTSDGAALGARYRIAAGNRGLYQQKLRNPVPKAELSNALRSERGRGHASASIRRWMIRVRTAAGGLTPKQLQTLCRIATRFGDGTLRLTTRQAIQLHGVASEAAPEAMRQLRLAMLHTAGSCGNAVRNLTCCPLPPRSATDRHLRELAARLATDFLPTGPAFACLPEWIEPSAESRHETAAGQPLVQDEPFAVERTSSPASSVLPHKWKVGLAVDGHNCVDVLNNDLGIVLRSDAEPAGRGRWLVDLYIGGSTAYQPDRDGSQPRLASWLGTVASGEAAESLRGLLEIFQTRVLGERRHFRRWKYVVERLGVEAIRDELHEQSGGRLALQIKHPPPREPLRLADDPQEMVQADGRTAFCLPIAGGRLPCTPELHEAVGELARLPITLRIGPQHRLVIADVRHQDRHTVRQAVDTIDQAATDGLHQRSLGHNPLAPAAQRTAGERVSVRGQATACPALPTCPLAVDEAERVVAAWWRVIDQLAQQHRVPPPRLAISGCANGCSRPLSTDIGLVAEKKHRRRVYLAGNGYRLAAAIATVTTPDELRALLQPYFTHYAQTRHQNETFTDWYWREAGS